MKQCLMIETQDHKKFFTYEKNLSQLIEFSKVFDAEISIVQIPNNSEILDLEALAPALCEKKTQKVDYTVLEIKLSAKNSRNRILSRANKIQGYIKKSLLDKEIVSLKQLNKKYKEVTNACLCNHFKKVRKELEGQGYLIVKVGGGKYKVQ